jgi:hypothetical protein
MPIYEFQCIGHVFEVILPISMCNTPVTCKIHKAICSKIPSRFSTLTDSKPTKYFVNNRTGQIQLAASAYDENPYGYEAKEAKGLSQRLELEKRLQNQDYQKAKGTYHAKQFEDDMVKKEYYEDMKAHENAVHTAILKDENTGKIIKEEKFILDNTTKDLMKVAKERYSKKKPKFKENPMIFPINHDNKSTRNSKE